MAMNVYLSNPQRKKERTDAGVSQREIYVAGIAKNTTQKELEELFSEVRNQFLVSSHFGWVA